MSWRLRVIHTTALKYSSPVSVSFNEARMTPADTGGQLLISHELRVEPRCRIFTYQDYWGTAVDSFDVHASHSSLEVVAGNVVDTPRPPQRPAGLAWSVLRGPEVRDSWCEYLRASQYVDDAGQDAARTDLVAQLRRTSTPRDAVDQVVEAVREHIAYVPGATSVSTTARESWAHGRGVCQDMSHATLSLLRAVGVPARYVSGYLYAGTGEIGETAVGESHAWVEFWDGAWHPCDPTNGLDVGEGHVVVARGRDYADVSPLKGVYAGGHSQTLGVTVSVTRLPR